MRHTRIVLPVLVLTLTWGADIAGAWLLPERHQIVLNGIVVIVSAAALTRWREHRDRHRHEAAIIEANEREAALIRTLERALGSKGTGPMPRLRDVA